MTPPINSVDNETRAFIEAVQLVEDAGWIVLRPEQVARQPINSVSDERLARIIKECADIEGVQVGGWRFKSDFVSFSDMGSIATELAARRAANTPDGGRIVTDDDGVSEKHSWSASPAQPSQVVDDKTIERAAKAIAESAGDVAWEKIEPLYQEGYRDEARAALTAALTLPERGM
jgi:hypothetical protein